MRRPERIDNFLKKVDWNKLWKRWGIQALHEKDVPLTFLNKKYLTYWRENPDQRIGQVLINLNLIPDNFKIWNDKESEILISQGIPPEECLYWGSIMNKNKELLDKPIYRLVKDMDKDHIQAIIDDGYKVSNNMKQAFNNVLNK